MGKSKVYLSIFDVLRTEIPNHPFYSGVFFRKCTRDQGSKLGLKGWCRNTERGTVEGVIEGSPDQVKLM